MKKDKMLHFIAGFVICILVSIIAYSLNFKQPEAYGLISAIIAGVLKEAFDCIKSKSLKSFDMFDFLATAFGGFIGLLGSFLF